MSKVEKNHRVTNNSQLKLDLNQAVKVLHGLLNGLDKIETGLVDSEKARAVENSCKEQLSKQEKIIDDLRNTLQNLEDERQKEVTSFATATLKLNEDFLARLRKQATDHQRQMEECRRREAIKENRWDETLKLEKTQIDRIRESEKSELRQLETKLKQAEQLGQFRESTLQKKLQEVEERLKEVSERNQKLMGELAQKDTIQKGRETEMNMLTEKLTALEAFPSKSYEKVIDLFAGL